MQFTVILLSWPIARLVDEIDVLRGKWRFFFVFLQEEFSKPQALARNNS